MLAASALVLATAAGLAAGCIKEKESLIVVSITAAADLPDANAVDITVGGTQRSYALAGLTRMTPVRRGIYVDSKTVGHVTVQVSVRAGTPCIIFGSNIMTTVPSAGATVNVEAKLSAIGPCTGGGTDAQGDTGGGTDAHTDTGGATDTRNDTGGANDTRAETGGTSDARGETGGGGLTPSLNNCREVSHAKTTDCNTDDPTIFSVAISPDGQLVATGGDDGRVKIWRFDGFNLNPEGHVLPGTGYGIVAWSPDGSLLAAGWQGGIDIYNTSSWTRQVMLLVTNTIYDLAFTPDGTQVISIDSDNLYAHNLTTPAALHTQPITELNWFMAVSPASSSPPVVAVGTQTGTVRVFTHTASGFVSAGQPLVADANGFHTMSVKFSNDGKLLAAGNSSGQLMLWSYPITSTTPTSPVVDVGTPTLSDDVNTIAFSPNGTVMAVGGGFFGSLSTWPIAPPRTNLATTTLVSSDVLSIVFSPDGRAIIGGEYKCGMVVVCAD